VKREHLERLLGDGVSDTSPDQGERVPGRKGGCHSETPGPRTSGNTVPDSADGGQLDRAMAADEAAVDEWQARRERLRPGGRTSP
jgi:hypothetical protein